MTTIAKENLITWLRDAYAMEGQAIELLEMQIQRLEHYPQAQPRLNEHLRETEEQQAKVEQCLRQLGSSPSVLKEGAMKFGANMMGLMQAMAPDEVLKHALTTHAFEQFEAGSYHSLVAAAEEAGEMEIARTCGQILREEQAMAAWVWEQLPELTREYLKRAGSSAAEAKR